MKTCYWLKEETVQCSLSPLLEITFQKIFPTDESLKIKILTGREWPNHINEDLYSAFFIIHKKTTVSLIAFGLKDIWYGMAWHGMAWHGMHHNN